MRTHVSLFAGIDAMSIAAERLGYTTTFAVEIDPFCQKVIAKRFPSTKILTDVRQVKGSDLGHVTALSMGFPCQDLSSAGKAKGLDGARSGLWFEGLRIISECRPEIVLIENVAVLKSRGLDVVVNGLASIGYGCWWDCVPALAVGAPHLRDRIWITAVPYEMMPDLEGTPFKEIRAKFPRAGASTARGLIEMQPKATIKMCKEAMGAVKREDGVTWLTAIDSPLFPTPSSSSYGSNRGGAAGRVGPIRHSLASMARSGEWPETNRCLRADQHISDCEEEERCAHCDGSVVANGQIPCFPTPCATDYKGANPLSRPRGDDDLPTIIKRQEEIPCLPTPTVGDSRNSTAGRTPGGNHHDGTTLSDFARIWPTPRANPRTSTPDSRSETNAKAGENLANAVVRHESRLWPSSSSSRDWKDTGEGRMGRGQLPEAVRAESRIFPTPRATDYKGANPLSRPRGDDDLPTRIKRQEEQRLWPTATAHPRTHTPRPVHHGMQLANEVAAEEARMWPTPRASPNELRTTKSAPSHGTTHGQVLSGVVCDAERDAGREVAEPSQSAGSLNPAWVEFLLGLPIGWTDLTVDEPIQVDWLSEHGIPRTAVDVADRKNRLMAIGNSLVWRVAYTRIEQTHRLLGINIVLEEDVA